MQHESGEVPAATALFQGPFWKLLLDRVIDVLVRASVYHMIETHGLTLHSSTEIRTNDQSE